MSYEVSWEPAATFAVSRYLKDDPAGLADVLVSVDALATEPRPAGTFPYGSEDTRRMRVGRYRVLYRIEDDVLVILVLHIGRAPRTE